MVAHCSELLEHFGACLGLCRLGGILASLRDGTVFQALIRKVTCLFVGLPQEAYGSRLIERAEALKIKLQRTRLAGRKTQRLVQTSRS